MTIYIASSWKNQHAVEMLTALLRERGHQVKSFVESNYESGSGANKPIPFEEWIHTDSAEKAFRFDSSSAMESDLVIYVGPSGKDAAAEVGMAYAKGIPIYGLYAKGEDFGLMRKMMEAWSERYPDLLKEIDKLNSSLERNTKLFEINETEWIAAYTKEEAIEFSGLENDEMKSISEIPQNEWDERIECITPNNEEKTVWVPIRKLMKDAIMRGIPCRIVTENN